MIRKQYPLWLLLAGFLWARSACGGEYWPWGPLLSSSALTLGEGQRLEAMGPLFYLEEELGGTTTSAFVPWISYSERPEVDFEEADFLYPFLTYNRSGRESRLQFFQLFSISLSGDQEGRVDRTTTVFPFYFHRASENPDRRYTAYFPVAGRLKNRLFRDEIRFLMFPLYVQTTKKGVVTDNYMAPFVHVRRGEGLSGWQVWPLVGQEVKSVTSRTNLLEEVEVVPGHEKFFAAWPLVFWQRTELGTPRARTNRVFLPLFSFERSLQRDSSAFLFSLFGVVDDREQGFREWHFPWPFMIRARGEGKTADRVFPLFSKVRKGALSTEFYLWPLYRRAYSDRPELYREHRRVVFFLYWDLLERNKATGEERRRRNGWPFFTWRKDLEGVTRLQVLAPVEPILPGNRGVERNWSPLWSLWRQECDPSKERTVQSALWNFYRSERRGAERKVSLLFGLFQYQSTPEGRRWRALRIPVKRRPAP